MAIEEPQFRPPEVFADAPIAPQAEAISLPLNPLTLLTTAPAAQELPAVLPAEEDNLAAVLPAAAPPHPGFWWGILWCLGFLFVTQIIPGITSVVIMIGVNLRDTPREQIRAKLKDPAWTQGVLDRSVPLSFFLAEITVVTFSLVAIRFVVGPDWKRRLGLRRPSWSQLILVLLSFPAVFVLGDGAYWLAKQLMPLEKLGFHMDMDQFVIIVRSWPWWFGVTVIGLGPGIGEELWCRGFLGRGFVGRYGVIPGILLTSFFFGAIHIDPRQGSMAMLLGIFLHYVYLTTRSLWMPMLLHFLVNSFSVTAGKISEISNVRMEAMDTDPEKFPWIMCVGSALLLAPVAWALYRSRTRLGVLVEQGVVPYRPDFPSVEFPSADSIAVVNRPWPGWLASSFVLAGIIGFAACVYLTVLQSSSVW